MNEAKISISSQCEHVSESVFAFKHNIESVLDKSDLRTKPLSNC